MPLLGAALSTETVLLLLTGKSALALHYAFVFECVFIYMLQYGQSKKKKRTFKNDFVVEA